MIKDFLFLGLDLSNQECLQITLGGGLGVLGLVVFYLICLVIFGG